MDRHIPRIMLFPETAAEFERIFPDEKTCTSYLFHVRWPDGFTCPHCRWQTADIRPSRTIVCPHCGNHTSLTTATVMHGTKKPLCCWLCAIWWLCSNDNGTSAKDLQRLLHLSSYQTAWTWMQKLRMVMASADRIPCRGTVECGCGTVAPAWERDQRALVLAAAESVRPEGITGRIRMRMIRELSTETIRLFLRDTVEPGSSILAPGLAAFLGDDTLESAGLTAATSSQPVRITEIISSFEIWLNRIHRGGVALKHMQHYLDEFCFRNNSSLLPDRKAVFTALLQGCMAGRAKPYRELVRQR